ncbi:hypothetical protein ACET3Z_011300 [Daucus carota]
MQYNPQGGGIQAFSNVIFGETVRMDGQIYTDDEDAKEENVEEKTQNDGNDEAEELDGLDKDAGGEDDGSHELT